MSGIIGGAGSKSGVIGETEIDYEEGTWGPVTVSTGTATSGVPRYVRVGNIVHLWWHIYGFSDRSTDINIVMSGFPFDSHTDMTGATTGSFMSRYCDTGANNLYWQNETQMIVYGNASGAWVNLNHNQLNNSTSALYCSASYRTT